MLSLHRKLTAIVAGCVLYGSMALPSASALTTSSNPTLTSDVTATVTAHKGTVFKRDFIDWNKETWGEPAQVNDNDKLREGMQIGTGNDSWAEVAWPSVKTRAWANTVFAVAPNKRLVYLTGGEMLFRLDKHRKDKDQPYYIWTKVLQARIRGTTVLVQAKGPVTRFTVMEGVVDIFNRLDHSRVTLHPGVVYEIKGYNLSNSSAIPGVGDTKPSANPMNGAILTPKQFDGSIKEITANPKEYEPIYQDKYAASNAYMVNKDVLMKHPLINAGGTIDSLPLIEREQGKELRSIAKGIELDAVPSRVNYFVGSSIGKDIKLPQTAYSADLAPTGVIIPPTHSAPAPVATTALAHPPVPAFGGMPVPITNTDAEAAIPSGNRDKEAAAAAEVFNTPAEIAEVFQVTPQPLPVQSYATSASTVVPTVGGANTAAITPTAIPSACFTPGTVVTGANAAFQSAAGVANVTGTIQTAGSIGINSVAPVMAPVTGLVGGATSAIMPTAPVAPTAVAPTAIVPTHGGFVNQTLQNTTNALNGLLR